MNALAIIAATMPLITNLIGYVNKLRAVARQSGELTPEEDAVLDARIKALTDLATQPEHWKVGNE